MRQLPLDFLGFYCHLFLLYQLRSGPRALSEAWQDERGGGGGGEVSGSTCTEAS